MLKGGRLLMESDEQPSLFPRRIERISQVGDSRRVPVKNSSEAAWVQDPSGRRCVIKLEENTGVESLFAEALSWQGSQGSG